MLIQSEHNGHHLTFEDGLLPDGTKHPTKRHSYTLDGEHVPGATTVVKGGYPTSEALISWMQGQAAEYVYDNYSLEKPKTDLIKEAKAASKKKAEEAAAVGTLVHDYAYHTEIIGAAPNELLDAIAIHPDNDKIQSGIDAFNKWHKENGDELVASESIVASPQYRFGGKFDRLARRGGKLILSDFKTSNSIHIDHKIQLSAYAIAIREWLGLRVEGLEVLRFGKENGDFETELITDPSILAELEAQAIRCRETYAFKLKYDSGYPKKTRKK